MATSRRAASCPVPVVRAPITRALVVVPTLDEADNIEQLLRGIRCAAPTVDVLVVDDASPDGTADLAEALGRSLGAITVARRHGEPGLGAAYRDGFRYALEHGYDAVIEMDADLSHDPASLPPLLAALDAGADLAIGTRYIDGGATPGWPWRRRMLVACRRRVRASSCSISRRTTRPRASVPSAPNCCATASSRPSARRASPSNSRCSTARSGSIARVVEIPIVFHDRVAGQSKLSGAIAQEALRMVNGLRRHPWQPANRPVLGA